MRWLPPLVIGLMLSACSSSDDDPHEPPDAAMASDQADAAPGGALPFMSPCDVQNDLCDSDKQEFCYSFNAKGPHCTHDCSSPAECDAPSPGCNNMGVCKAPD